MRTWPSPLIDQLHNPNIRINHLVKTPWGNFTDADHPQYVDGLRYIPTPLKLEVQQDQVKITLSNLDQAFTTILLGEERRGDWIDCYLASWANYSLVSYALIFSGVLDEIPTLGLDEAVLVVRGPASIWERRTLRRHSPLCYWRFKDPETCAYNGTESTCNKTWERCSELGNTNNFGGFRHLPELMDKKVIWKDD